MHILKPMSDWESVTMKSGKNKNKIIKKRLVLAIDNYNWILCWQRDDKTIEPQDRKFFRGFQHLFPRAVSYYKQDPFKVIDVTGKMLFEKFGKLPEKFKISSVPSIDELEALGRTLDMYFEIDFIKHNNIVERVTGQTIEDDEEEE